MSMPLLQTKLYAPPSRANLIRRPLLAARLCREPSAERFNAGGLRPLTLIAAPAGFGKTTLVSEWINTSAACGMRGAESSHTPHSVAWLALDEDDNDMGRFFTYLLAALRTVGPADLGAGVLALLQSPQPPPLRTLLASLAHELSANLPHCVLVLDDYHVISAQAIHDTLIFLLDHVPALRWIITTRADPPLPLGRLRARQQLLELRSTDLRFTPAETAQFFNEVMEIVLPPAAVEKLAAHTEGWITGLQLAALAMQSSPDRAAFIRDFSGSHRYVADYLADEVLNHLPDQTQRFLLHTAITERMCAELCDALLEPYAADAAQSQPMLEALERANLFLIPLDGERRWYRYHHLFADLLRQRLHRRHPQLVSELHRRAAAWLAQNGLVEDAIRHLIAGKAFVQAADLLEQSHETLWMQGQFVMLRHWLAFLPKAILEEHPRLLLAQAWTHVLTDSAADMITALFQQAEAAILHTAGQAGDGQSSTTELQGVLAAIRAVYHSKQEDSAGVIANAQQALAGLPQPVGRWRSIALMCLGFAYEMDGAVRAAQQTFAEAIRLCQTSGNHYSALVSTMRLARTYLVQGQLHAAATIYTQALAEATQRGMGQLPNTVHAHINLGRINYEWNNLATAIDHLQLGLACLQDQGGSWLQFEGYVLLARAKQSQGEFAAAVALLHQAEQVAQTIPFPWTKVAAAATLVRARLALGQDAGAVQWLAQAQPHLTDGLSRLREAEHFTAAGVLIAQGRTTEALPLLTHIIQDAEGAGRMKGVVESCVLAALAHQLQGERQSAQATLRKALTLAEPEGYIRSFVDEGEVMRQMILDVRAQGAPAQSNNFRFSIDDSRLQVYLERILTAFSNTLDSTTQSHPKVAVAAIQNHSTEDFGGRSRAAHEPPKSKIQTLIEPLSDRELELLQLMAAGLSNQEIADRLIITLGTVKSHANHIFGKLGVQGRVKAINRARELDLI